MRAGTAITALLAWRGPLNEPAPEPSPEKTGLGLGLGLGLGAQANRVPP